MKTFLLSIPQRLRLKSQELDVQAALCDKSWTVFNDEGVKQLFIFLPDGTLLITTNGIVYNSTWKYISANQSIVITSDEKSVMFHPAFLDDVVFALQQDGESSCLFMIDERNRMSFLPRSLAELNAYFIQKDRYLDSREEKTAPLHSDLESTSYNQVKRKYCKLVNNENGNGHKEIFEEKIDGLFLCKHRSSSGDIEYWYEFHGEKCSDIYERCSSVCYGFIMPVDNSFLIVSRVGTGDISIEKWDVFFKDSTEICEYDEYNFEYRFPCYSYRQNYEWTGLGFPSQGEMYLVS